MSATIRLSEFKISGLYVNFHACFSATIALAQQMVLDLVLLCIPLCYFPQAHFPSRLYSSAAMNNIQACSSLCDLTLDGNPICQADLYREHVSCSYDFFFSLRFYVDFISMI